MIPTKIKSANFDTVLQKSEFSGWQVCTFRIEVLNRKAIVLKKQ